jgi:tetratricopeptide (TPR) repeat protein
MAKRKEFGHKSPRRQRKAAARPVPPANQIGLRRIAGEQAWELVHPRCAQERAEDMQQVQQMVAAGEIDIARDELRWLLEECTDFIEAHKLLGELALAEDDLALARGHFGNAFQLGQAAIGRTAPAALVPYQRPANQPFFESGKGLAWCQQQLDKPDLAKEVLEQLLAYDPSDPLNLREMIHGPA